MHMTRQELLAARERERDEDLRIKHVDADPKRDDANERTRTVASMLPDGDASIAALAFTLGAPRSHYGDANTPIAARLLADVREGRLHCDESLTLTGGVNPARRHNVCTVRVTRAAFAQWLKTHGTLDDQTSAAAQWARSTSD